MRLGPAGGRDGPAAARASGRLAPRLGLLGFWGFLLTFLGNLLCALPHVLVMSLIGPTVAEEAPQLISEHDQVIAAGPFETEQAIAGIALLAGLLALGVAVLRNRELPRWIGWCGIAGAAVAFVPLPVTAVVSGVQIELLRGLMVAGLGLYVFRTARASSERPAYLVQA